MHVCIFSTCFYMAEGEDLFFGGLRPITEHFLPDIISRRKVKSRQTESLASVFLLISRSLMSCYKLRIYFIELNHSPNDLGLEITKLNGTAFKCMHKSWENSSKQSPLAPPGKYANSAPRLLFTYTFAPT